ncbi:MAG: sulfite exporter TauE/SafE family protein [Thermodesulfobacteriota bacterium]
MYEQFSLTGLGLVYGTTVCSLTCLPYLGPYLMGTGRGFVDGLSLSLVFILGKLCTYTALGGLAGFLGETISTSGSHNLVMGITLAIVTLTLPLVTKGRCPNRCQAVTRRGSLFVLGIVSSLIPCPPLVAVFLLAANNGTAIGGLSYGFFYGIGLVVSPMLIVGGGLGMISEKIKTEAGGFTPFMQGLVMLIMMVMATNMIMSA